MTEEHTQYASTILVSKLPVETSRAIDLRFQANNALNEELIALLGDLRTIEDRYAGELQKLANRARGIERNAHSSVGLGEEVDFTGLLAPLWHSVTATIQAKITTTERFSASLHRDVLRELKNFAPSDPRNKETAKLIHSLGSLAAEVQGGSAEAAQDWSSRAPYILESFENYDLIRLSVLREVFLKLQTNWNDQLGVVAKASEKSTALLLNFDPLDEIVRFSQLAVANTFPPRPTTDLPASGHRVSSVASNATGSTFHNSSTLMNGFSEPPAKHNRLKSKVGSIFGRKKKDKAKTGNGLPQVPEKNGPTPAPRWDPTTSSRSAPVGRTQELEAARKLRPPVQQSWMSESDTSREAAVPAGGSVLAPAADPSLGGFPGSLQGSSTAPAVSMTPLEPTIKVVERGLSTLSTLVPATPSVAPLPNPEFVSLDGSASSNPAEKTDARRLSAIAPAPPPARKNTIRHLNEPTLAEGEGEGSSEANFSKRKEIHSRLFHDLPAANASNRESVLMSRPPSMAAGQLVAQNTGSTVLGKHAMFMHHALDVPGLSASVAEVVNASFKEGVQVKAQTIGEVAFCFKDDALPEQVRVKFTDFSSLGKTLVNPQVLHQTDDNTFFLDPVAVHQRSLGALKYQLDSTATRAPIVILPAWRFEEHQASVMLLVKLAPAYAARLPPSGITLNNVVISVSVTGAPATSASSRPQGSFSKEKSRITWKYTEPLTLSATQEERLVARFATDGLARESDLGVQIKFSISLEEASLSVVGANVGMSSAVTFDDVEGPFVTVPCFSSVCSGSYGGLA